MLEGTGKELKGEESRLEARRVRERCRRGMMSERTVTNVAVEKRTSS